MEQQMPAQANGEQKDDLCRPAARGIVCEAGHAGTCSFYGTLEHQPLATGHLCGVMLPSQREEGVQIEGGGLLEFQTSAPSRSQAGLFLSVALKPWKQNSVIWWLPTHSQLFRASWISAEGGGRESCPCDGWGPFISK